MAAIEIRARRFWLLTIYVSGVLAIVAARMLRDQYSQGPVLGFVLGSLPNFIAAASFPPLIMSWRKQYTGMASGLAASAMAQIVILCWEFFQLSRSEMVFDTNDIVATLLGGLAWVLIWPVLDRSMRSV